MLILKGITRSRTFFFVADTPPLGVTDRALGVTVDVLALAIGRGDH